MLMGFNTNVTYKGDVFHVQTEDSGTKNPVITTLLYRGGVILASKKTSYKELLNEEGHPPKEKIRQLMSSQHKEMISDLFSGKFDDVIEKIVGISGNRPLQNEISSTGADEWKSSQDLQGPERVVRSTVDENEGSLEKKKMARSLDDILLEHILRKTK